MQFDLLNNPMSRQKGLLSANKGYAFRKVALAMVYKGDNILWSERPKKEILYTKPAL